MTIEKARWIASTSTGQRWKYKLLTMRKTSRQGNHDINWRNLAARIHLWQWGGPSNALRPLWKYLLWQWSILKMWRWCLPEHFRHRIFHVWLDFLWILVRFFLQISHGHGETFWRSRRPRWSRAMFSTCTRWAPLQRARSAGGLYKPLPTWIRLIIIYI